MSLLYAQQVIVDIQNRLGDMTKEEIMQALEVARITLINEETTYSFAEDQDAEEKKECQMENCGPEPSDEKLDYYDGDFEDEDEEDDNSDSNGVEPRS